MLVRCCSTSPLNPSFGSSLTLCNQVAQSNFSPSRLATLTNSVALLQPTSRSRCLEIFVKFSWIAIRYYAFRRDSGKSFARNSLSDCSALTTLCCVAATSWRCRRLLSRLCVSHPLTHRVRLTSTQRSTCSRTLAPLTYRAAPP